MGKLLICILSCISLIGNATNYYFSNAGTDGNTGTSKASPWATISKFNSFFSSFQPGDSVLFNRGDVFFGSMIISRSGTVGNPIKISAYGSGAKPVISGFYTVPSWVSIGSGLYEATIPAALPTLNMVTLDGAFKAMGRWPKAVAANSGYLTLQSHTGVTSITSNAIASALNYVGGELAVRDVHWVIDRGLITAQNSTTVTYTAFDTPIGSPYQPTDGFGFFFQNHPNACTVLGEWAYTPATHKITMFFGGSTPGTFVVKVSAIDNLINILLGSISYVTFDNLAVTGANLRGFNMFSNVNHHIVINNCDFSYSGEDAVYIRNNTDNNITLSNCTISFSNNNAITSNNATNWAITGNTIINTGVVAGMGVSGDGQYQATAYIGNNSLVELNSVTNTGYIGIHLVGVNTVVQKNFINFSCLTKDDGAAIYSYGNGEAGSKILDNIVLNTVGRPNGTTDLIGSAFGIYMDDDVSGVEIARNTSAGNARSGIFIHNANTLNIHNNTFYNNAADQIHYYNNSGTIGNLTLTNNIFFSRLTSQYVSSVSNEDQSSVAPWFTLANNNHYCRPLNENNDFEVWLSSGYSNTNLAGWQALTAQEAGSQVSPISLTDVNQIRFDYNATNAPAIVPLGGDTYVDALGKTYSRTITLSPYGSAVLMQTTTVNSPPVVNAGVDQTITLPTTAATLTGTASDPDGSIASVLWAQIGGTTSTISSPSTLTTGITGLSTTGPRTYKLQATDNLGATASDTVAILVNQANQLPNANAGPDQVDSTEPSITLTGSGTDADGTIVAYLWTQISGPSTASITSPSEPITGVTNIVIGQYIFQLLVTDNVGAIGTNIVIVTVISTQPPTNQPTPPTANAGPNIKITRVCGTTGSATVTGTGVSGSGVITSYLWSYVSGPAGSAIASPNAAQTVISGLRHGVYVFQFKVSDSDGLFGTDKMNVRVSKHCVAAITKHCVTDGGQIVSIY